MRVGLLVTCLVDGLVPSVGKATVEVLGRLGVRVEVPSGQGCCGQMHTNTGYGELTRPLAEAYARVFEPYDYVVTPSGSCAGSVRHQHQALTGKPPPRTVELSEFLIDVLGVEDVGATYPHRVTYHPTCHSLRLLRVGDRPLRLLRHVRGLELVELPEAESCCGFGGTFAMKNPDVSAAMLADKIRHVQATGTAVCTAGDVSCLMHIGGGLSRLSVGARAVHLAEILASRG
jgi:L-lactate dehydrogenase complex protein LldE